MRGIRGPGWVGRWAGRQAPFTPRPQLRPKEVGRPKDGHARPAGMPPYINSNMVPKHIGTDVNEKNKKRKKPTGVQGGWEIKGG